MRRRILSSVCVGLVLVMAACGRKADVKKEVSELEKSFPASASPAPAPTPAEPAAAPVPQQQASADELVKAALAAARANDYAGGVIALQEAQRRPGLTPDQVMAAQRAKQAMAADLAARAANGDEQAKAQLQAIEKTRSQ